MNPNTNFTPETFDLTKLSLKIPGYNFKINSGTVTDKNVRNWLNLDLAINCHSFSYEKIDPRICFILMLPCQISNPAIKTHIKI